VYGEFARVVRATGAERGVLDEPLDARPFVGQEVVVVGAEATPAQDGWMTAAVITSLDDVYYFPEEALEATGEVELEDIDGSKRRVPLDRTRDRWRDDVLLTLTTDTTNPTDAKAIAERAAAALSAIASVAEVQWRVVQWAEERVEITLWAWSDGDALDAFADIVGVTNDGWEHDEDESLFIVSRWTRVGKSEFLAAGVERADVCYRCWMTPRRRSRADITSGST
jgi:hypothetical protein